MIEIKVTLTSRKFSGQSVATKYSPYGLSLRIEHEEAYDLLEKNEEVLLKVGARGRSVRLHATVLEKKPVVMDGRSVVVVEVAFIRPKDANRLDRDLRREARFILERFNGIVLNTKHPVRRSKNVTFTVTGFSRNGIKLETEIENDFIIPGLVLDMDVRIPKHGDHRQTVLVRYVNKSADSNSWSVGCTFEKPSRDFLASLGDYCLACSPSLTIRDLQRNGFPISFDSKAMKVKIRNDPNEMYDIIELRRKAYGGAGTWGLAETDPLDKFKDTFDTHAVHISVKFGERTVGATRVVFNDGEHAKSEIIAKGYTLPDEVLKGRFVEFSKMCTDPDFRNASVLMRLGMEATRASIEYGADFIVAIARDYMVPTYKCFGLEHVGQRVYFGDQEWNLMVGNISKIMRGESMPFLTWSFMAIPLIRDLEAKNMRKFSIRTRIKANIAWQLRPVFERAIASKRKRS